MWITWVMTTLISDLFTESRTVGGELQGRKFEFVLQMVACIEYGV